MQISFFVHPHFMTRLTLTFLTTILLTNIFGQKNYCGEYVTNFPTYGMFGQTLKLNCDSTAIFNFRGDLLNDNSFGRWTIQNKTLTIIFDTSKPNARYKDTLSFKIKRQRLYRIGITKKMYDKYKAIVEQHNKETGDSLQMPSFKKFDNQLNQTPKNFYGKTGKQYFKKSKSYSCDRIQLPPTLGFMQVGHDLVTSAICKCQLQLQQTNIYQLLYLTSSTYFQSAAVMGRRNSISPGWPEYI